MGRKILAVIVALITAGAIIMIVEMIASRISGVPANLEYMSRDEAVAYFASRSPLNYAAVLVGYILASFFGGFIVTKMSRRESPGIQLPILIGIFLMLGSFLNFFVMLPGQPLWFVILTLISFIPVSLLGHRFAR